MPASCMGARPVRARRYARPRGRMSARLSAFLLCRIKAATLSSARLASRAKENAYDKCRRLCGPSAAIAGRAPVLRREHVLAAATCRHPLHLPRRAPNVTANRRVKWPRRRSACHAAIRLRHLLWRKSRHMQRDYIEKRNCPAHDVDL